MCHNSHGMKRCLFVLVYAAAAMWGQDRPFVVLKDPLPDADQLKSFEDAFRRGEMKIAPNAVLFETAPVTQTCVVPLLAAPINPNADRTMPVVRPPKLRSENAGVAKGLPPCERRAAK